MCRINAFKLSCCTLFVLLLLASVSAQSIQSGVDVQIVDSRTGYAVKNAHIIVSQPFDNTNVHTIFQDAALFRLHPLVAEASLTVAASGYESSVAKIAPVEGQQTRYTFFLDPEKPPHTLERASIESRKRDEATLMTGYVTDKEAGFPLAGVRIYSPETDLQTTTDNDGFFELYQPLDLPTATLVFEHAGYITEMRPEILLWSRGDWQFRIRMSAGDGTHTLSKSTFSEQQCVDCESQQPAHRRVDDPVIVPETIRVGRDCASPTSCAEVEVYSLQTYAKLVVPHEWFSCWGDLTNGEQSLQAGSVSVRSYGVWHINHPLNFAYDICDNTFCQFLGDSQTSNGNDAVDATDRFVLWDTFEDEVARSEYSAENNDSGCGDEYTGTGTDLNPCIFDPVCSGELAFGHGRGLCQWGSARWASGTHVQTSSPCSDGWDHGFGSKDWEEILDHYYPWYELTEGIRGSIIAALTDPETVSPGQTFAIDMLVEVGPTLTLLIGASVAPTGSGAWIDDPDNDISLIIDEGQSVISRLFDLPDDAADGAYDVFVSLRYDANGNGQIDTGDPAVDSEVFTSIFTVGPTYIETIGQHIPKTLELDQNFPNPFNPNTTFRFSIPAAGHTNLRIFDALGKEIVTLVDDQLSPGQYEIEWSASGFPSGQYFYRLSSNGEVRNGKLIISK